MKRIIPISLILTILPGCFTVTAPATSNEEEQDRNNDSTMNTNSAPSISGTPNTSTKIGNYYSFLPRASDSEGDDLTFYISNKPSWATFDERTGEMFGTPDKEMTHNNIEITVSDGEHQTSLDQFQIDVQASPKYSVEISWETPSENTDGSSLSNISKYKVSYGKSINQQDQITYFDASQSNGIINDLEPGEYYFSMSTITENSLVSDASATYYFQVSQ